jgi:single-strand DNA-binding protein
MVNKVILVGRLTADPDVRATAKGVHVATLRLATNIYGGKDEEGNRKEHTEFHSLVLFGRQAEVAGDFLRKGRLVYADGRLQTRKWDDAEGNKRQSIEVVVDNLQMLTAAPTEAA